jgi:phosphoribosylaminoimidazolecarboxamide formyltransferase/IMP cyclohydrolase
MPDLLDPPLQVHYVRPGDLLDGGHERCHSMSPGRLAVLPASRVGVCHVIEPGGSSRSADVAAACAEYGMTLVRTGLRLFHH